MKFASLGSGSSGNATLVTDGETLLMVDCGFGIKETVKRMARLDVEPQQIDAIVVTHEHADHIKGVAPLARKFNIPVYMTRGTYLAKRFGDFPELQLIENYQQFAIADIGVIPVAVPHDAREPAQYIFRSQNIKLGVLTDLGKITPHIIMAYRFCQGLLVEANHDLEMLRAGPYPPMLKYRVGGDWGHLNNGQTAEFLDAVGLDSVQQLVVGHISVQNNSVACANRVLEPVIKRNPQLGVHYACQDQGFGWIELRSPQDVGVDDNAESYEDRKMCYENVIRIQ